MGEVDRILREGSALHDAGKYEAALALYVDAVSRWPALAPVWNNRGNSLLGLRRFEEAAESYQCALELWPELNDTRVALASCLQALGKIDEAMEACDLVLSREPDHAEAHWNRALLLLLKGEYLEGWKEYEWRWKKRGFTSPSRAFDQPLWQGEPLAGRTILIHAEQGYGDTIQFCRYLPLLINSGAMVLFECHPPLVRLMKQLGPGIEVIPMGEPLPGFDCHLPLLSLPAVLGTTIENIPAVDGYLSAPPDSAAFWQRSIPKGKDARIGLCWAGKSYPDPGRSIPPKSLSRLSTVSGVSWYSLQIGQETGSPALAIMDLAMLVKDFADTAALIAQLDLVITIDTSVAHLAGAMGKETWLMVPSAPDWRWGLERTDSPWYRSMRIFRQDNPKSWKTVVDTVIKELKLRIQSINTVKAKAR
jgi:Tetratricopeptide repeat